MRKVRLLLFILLLTPVFLLFPEQTGAVVDGVLDLTGFDYGKGNILLDGEWTYREGMETSLLGEGKARPFPRAWAADPREPGSYRLRIKGAEPGRKLYLRTERLPGFHALFLNNQYLGGRGTPGGTIQSESAGFEADPYVIVIPSENFYLTVQVSNFRRTQPDRRGSIYLTALGKYNRILYIRGMAEFLIQGILICTIFIYTSMYFMDRKRREFLYFRFAGVGLSLMSLSSSALIPLVFPTLGKYEILFRAHNTGFITALIFMVLFFSRYRGPVLHPGIVGAFALLMGLTEAVLLTVPAGFLYHFRMVMAAEFLAGFLIIAMETIRKISQGTLHPLGILPGMITLALFSFFQLFIDSPLASDLILHLTLLILVMQQLMYHTFLSMKNYTRIREMNRDYLKLNLELKDSLNRIEDQAELIQFITNRDSVSGLPNKNQLPALFERETSRLAAGETSLCFVMAEWEDLKDFLSRRGLTPQMEIIRQFADRARRFCTGEDWVCRYSDDRFLFILTQGRGEVEKRVNRLYGEFTRPVESEEGIYNPRINMGYTLWEGESPGQETTLRRLFSALDYARREQRHEPCRFTRRIDTYQMDRIRLEGKFRQALRKGMLEVHYQPQHDSWQYEVTGLEALIRWNDPDRGWVPPEEFIPLAEELGLIEEIDLYAARTVLAQMAKWGDSELGEMRVSLNLSPTNFVNPVFVENIIAMTRRSGISPSRLELELTETMFVYNRKQIRKNFFRLKNEGFTIALDDFGTGYSSLAYLTEFPVDVLKIDKAFINCLSGDDRRKDIVKSIIAIGHALGLRIISEGVEKEEDLRYLRKTGCHGIQGYFFSPPLPPSRLLEYIRKTRSA